MFLKIFKYYGISFSLLFLLLSSFGYCSLYSMAPIMDLIEIVDNDNGGQKMTSCPIGYFQCNSTTQCVAQRLNCDGFANCDDGSDEWDCDDTVPAVFWDNLFRKQPYGRSDHIPLGSCFWSDLNTTCPCRGTELLCRFLNLNSLPINLPENGITMLDLTGNNFSVIHKEFFLNLPVVETIVLKFCSISKIESFAFEGFSSSYVETIYLDENNLQSLPVNLFPPKNLIKTLILSSNKINILHSYDFENLENLFDLDLRNNEISSFTANVFRQLKSLEILHLNGNKLQNIRLDMFPELNKLQTLSLANNQIKTIARNSLRLPKLVHLFLSSNQLKTIQSKTFCGLPKLIGLNLDDNRITKFEDEAFKCVENLTSLDLTKNKFKTLDSKILEDLTNLNHIYFSWFHLCRAALHVRVCEPKSDGISSVYHLLDNPVLRVSVWIMSAIGIIGNSIVLFSGFCSKPRTHVDHILYLRHLAASDLIMGIYLAVIATADFQFRGEYLLHDELWRYSQTCSLCGFLSTLSCQSSTLLLTLITWDRLVSVTQPLQIRKTGTPIVTFRLTLLWGVSVAAAAAPFADSKYFGSHFYGNNGVCLSLHIHDPYAKGWEYSAGLFIVINTFSLIFIMFSYIRMLQAIRGSAEAMRSTMTGRENVVARRFAVIVATDCLCWFPIILVKLLALGGMKIPSSLYAWLAVLVLPVNSALNPVLYTLTTASFKQQIRRYFYKLPMDSARHSHSQTNSISLGHFTNGSHRKRLLPQKLSYV